MHQQQVAVFPLNWKGTGNDVQSGLSSHAFLFISNPLTHHLDQAVQSPMRLWAIPLSWSHSSERCRYHLERSSTWNIRPSSLLVRNEPKTNKQVTDRTCSLSNRFTVQNGWHSSLVFTSEELFGHWKRHLSTLKNWVWTSSHPIPSHFAFFKNPKQFLTILNDKSDEISTTPIAPAVWW